MNENLIKPFADRVVVKKERIEETKSGLVLPPSTDGEGGGTSIGVVVSVGEGRKNEKGEIIPISLKKGDKVIFSWSEKVEVEGNEYYLVSESSILGVINN